jgi:LCP family protein required for cell wall assembly
LQLLGAALLIELVFSVTWTVLAVQAVAPRTTAGDLVAAALGQDEAQGTLVEKLRDNQRVNLLLLARGGAGDDNPDFTDTMLVLSIRPKTAHATVISLPRYLWVDIPAPVNGTVRGKLYSAFAVGASQDPNFLRPQWRTSTGQGDLAAATIRDVIGQPIDAWIAVDLRAFEALIDAIGGIRITIPAILDDPRYPSDEDEQTIHIHFDPGTQTLDGRHALQYARSRRSTSESERSQRQELVLFAMLTRLKSAGMSPSLVSAAGQLKDGVRTNLTLGEARALMPIVSAITPQNSLRITLEDSPLLTTTTVGDGVPVLVPATGTYDALRAFVAGQLP